MLTSARRGSREDGGWGGMGLGEVLATGPRRSFGAGSTSGTALSPPLTRQTSSEDRPIRGAAGGTYDMSFVDMENEWERVTEYAVVDGALATLMYKTV